MTEPQLYFSREYSTIGADRQLRLLYEPGRLTRIAPGAYVESAQWTALTEAARYRTRIVARAVLYPDTQFSHDSAAAVWQLPSIGRWSPHLHARVDRTTGGRSKVGIRRHALGLDNNPRFIDGALVTSLGQTLVDSASQVSFTRAVAMVDDGLRMPRADDHRFLLQPQPPTAADLLSCLDESLPFPGSARARRAIEFASPLSATPGESLSRVQIHAIGFPPPQLQVEFFDDEGLIGVADFYWPEFDLIGEFDGIVKYGSDRMFQRALSDRDILIAEKRREDRMRRVVRSFARWDWATARNRRALEQLLREHGLLPAR